ncbi:hypothetical protein NC652_033133 [Populus alba x Populus x berolinensis]|nr:hypothetical protein NC652_033133 [Populus alba x Populus x berolinensis]
MKRYIPVTRFPPVYLLSYQSEAPFHQLWNCLLHQLLCVSQEYVERNRLVMLSDEHMRWLTTRK